MQLKKVNGFTLLECLIALTLFAIMSSLLFWSWHDLLKKNSLIAITERIVNAIQFARHMAIVSGQQVSFCGSADQSHCDGNWDQGQIVQMQLTQQLIRVFPKIPAGFHLDWKSSFSLNKQLSFNANGFTAGQQGHFTVFSTKNSKPLMRIVILGTGRIRIASQETVSDDSQQVAR